MLFSDNMMIPKTSDRADAAMAWVNYVYDPVVSAKIVQAAPYISSPYSRSNVGRICVTSVTGYARARIPSVSPYQRRNAWWYSSMDANFASRATTGLPSSALVPMSRLA
jgi:hypothetical protein